MRSLRFLPALLATALSMACGAPADSALDGDTDELSDATVSMEMVRKNPALAPTVAVPERTAVKGRKPPMADAFAPTHDSLWNPSLPGNAWLIDAANLGQFKDLTDPKMDADGAKIGSYMRLPGDLFASDGQMKWDNVQQGYLGDCYFAASLAAVLLADKGGALTKNMIVPVVSGGKVVDYQATFFQASGRKVTVKVDPDLPHKTASSKVMYMRSTDTQPGYEEWATSLVEKGYATWHKSYSAIGGGGTAADAIFALTGKVTRSYSPGGSTTVAAIEAAGKTSRAQVACTHGEHDGVNYDGTGVYADHCYTLRGVVRKAGKVYIQLRNPWGPIVSAVEPTEPPDDGVPDGLFDLEYSKFTTLYSSVDILP